MFRNDEGGNGGEPKFCAALMLPFRRCLCWEAEAAGVCPFCAALLGEIPVLEKTTLLANPRLNRLTNSLELEREIMVMTERTGAKSKRGLANFDNGM